MDNHKSEYFLYGGIFSFSFFVLLLLALYAAIIYAPKSEFYTDTDNIVVSIGLDDTNLERPQTKKEIKESETEEVVEDLDDIFDSIETEKIVYSKKSVVKENVVDKEFLKKVQTRTNIKHEKQKQKKRTVTEDLELEYGKFKSQEKHSKASGGVKDVYKGKIYKILYQGWNHTSESYRHVQVYIRISATGKMRYEIKQVSGDSEFDSILQAHLEYLLDTIFPISPDGKAITFKVDFTTKGRE
jgi:hypothetical protein